MTYWLQLETNKRVSIHLLYIIISCSDGSFQNDFLSCTEPTSGPNRSWPNFGSRSPVN